MIKPLIPASVPLNKRTIYGQNWTEATKGTGKLLILAADQKVEHLNDDFVGAGISPEAADPEHYFKIMKTAGTGVLAGHIGLLDRYGSDYPDIPYILKLNGRTNLVKAVNNDAFSAQWLEVSQALEFKQASGLKIVGVGFTVYLGNDHEAEMLRAAAQTIFQAHQAGLLTVLWIYFKGRSNDASFPFDAQKEAGAAGVGLSLGADFVKLVYNYKSTKPQDWKKVPIAAGRTGVIFAGGDKMAPELFLQKVAEQSQVVGSRGLAVGRNVYQYSLNEAVALFKALGSLVYENVSLPEAIFKFKNHHKK